jgi:hypothetical protein
VVRCCWRSQERHRGGAGQGGECRGALERCDDGEVAQVASGGGGVAPVVVDERGEVLQLKGDQRVRRRRSIEEWSSSEGAHRKGADGGDARTESGAEEGLQQRKASETDAWAVGEACASLGRGRTRRTARGGEKDRLVAPFKGRRGIAERGGGSGSGDAPRCGGDVGPGSDRRAAPRPRPGRPRTGRDACGRRASVSAVAHRRG